MEYTYTIRLSDTDAAGRIFFAAAGRIAHDAWETWMETKGLPIAGIIRDAAWGLPVVQSATEFHKPLALGDRITITTRVAQVGRRSVTFSHQLHRADGSVAARVTMTHVAVSARTGKAIALPKALLRTLQA